MWAVRSLLTMSATLSADPYCFTVADDDLIRSEIDVLDTQATAFQQAEPRSVEKERHQARHAVELREDGPNFLAREDDRQPLRRLGAHQAVEPGQFDVEHLAVEKEQGAQRLVLGGG